MPATKQPNRRTPTVRVNRANAAARVQPVRDGFINAVQVYPFSGGALYQVYTAPQQITDIALEDGEQLVGSGPVAAGDTVRWIIGDTTSGVGPSLKVHILIKPTRPDLITNLVINTDRRTYFLELRSTEKTYMASVSWQYPEDQLIALQRQNVEGLCRGARRNGHRRLRVEFPLCDRRRHAGLAAFARFRRRGRRSTSNSRAASFKAKCRRSSSSVPAALPNSSITASARTITSSIVSSGRQNYGSATRDSERRVRIVRTDGRRRS